MAAKTTSVELGEKLTAYTRRKVESGEFGSASEVIRDALRRAEERDLVKERLRELIREGEASGPAERFDLNQLLGEMRERHDKSATTKTLRELHSKARSSGRLGRHLGLRRSGMGRRSG